MYKLETKAQTLRCEVPGEELNKINKKNEEKEALANKSITNAAKEQFHKRIVNINQEIEMENRKISISQ